MTPSFFRQINTHCNILQLKTLILGGEQFPSISNQILQQMIKQNKRIINIYGLTEMSCWASYYILNENDSRRKDGIPLGKPLNETSIILQPFIENKDYFQMILGRVY
jgi:non-ribosomal peptide synthetase component F